MSYIDRVLVNNFDLGHLGCPNFYSVIYPDDKFVRVQVNFDKLKLIFVTQNIFFQYEGCSWQVFTNINAGADGKRVRE